MADSTRRGFLLAAGAGATAIGVAAIAPAAQAAPATGKADTPGFPDIGPFVAYVSNPGEGELTLLIGEREVQVKDRDLVARLTRAAS